jgi:hypothetical protein
MKRNLIVGSRASFDYETVEYALRICTVKDEIVLTGSVPVDDLAARYAYENGIALRTKVLDTQLHGTNARYYMLSKLVEEVDRIIFFDSDNDELLKSIYELAESRKIETIYLNKGKRSLRAFYWDGDD